MTRAVAVVGILAISFSAILVEAADVSPDSAAFFRGAYALPALLLTWLAVRRRDARSLRSRLVAVTAGLCLAVDLSLWHRSIGLMGAGLPTVLANLQVLFVAFAAWALHGERPTRAAAFAVPVALGGVALASGVGRADAYGVDPATGTLLAVLAGVAYTGYLLALREGARGKGHPAGPILDATAGMTAGALVLGLVFDARFSLVPSWPAHGYLLLLALFAHALGWLFIAHAMPRLPALDTSILLLLQPCLTVLWAVLIFREAPSLVQWLGVGLVLAGVGIASLRGAARTVASPVPQPAGDKSAES